MIHTVRINPPRHVYPVDPWRLIESHFYQPLLGQTETMFALSNGYIGMRGNFEEGSPTYHRATLINGFFESWPIKYPEAAYGFAKNGQTIVNVTDAKTVRLFVDDEPFSLTLSEVDDYERVLDMQNGCLDRRLVWKARNGKKVRITSRRMVSLVHRHMALVTYTVSAVEGDFKIRLTSDLRYEHTRRDLEFDPRVAQRHLGRILAPRRQLADAHLIVLSHETTQSELQLASGVDHAVVSDAHYEMQSDCGGDYGTVQVTADLKAGQSLTLHKFIAYHTSATVNAEDLCEHAVETLHQARAQGVESIERLQREYLDDFWHRADVEFSGDDALQQAIRFNLFQLIQAAARSDGAGIPAKGLTGMGYEGHYFWDTEIYILPFMTYTMPEIARNLLSMRFRMLPKARERADQVNQRGALFPWRTIDGDEASAYYAAGTAQYHINADIAYAICKYADLTGDTEFLHGPGAEILVETARFWVDLGFFSARREGKFCIQGVTGPDEYNTVVDNNTYTNLMARENLRRAVRVVRELRTQNLERYMHLADQAGLEPQEVEVWELAAENMYVPYDESLGIHPQDDSFLDKEPWDFEGTPQENYPLLLHYHPLVIYRHQVIKQADVVLALLLLGHDFTLDQKRRNFDFYDPLTTGDSSLSVGIQSIIAWELRYLEKAREYGWHALHMDLGDIHGNVADGCHVASTGAAWMACAYGIGGLRDTGGAISFRPVAVKVLERMRFRITVRGELLEVDIDRAATTYRLIEGQAFEFAHFDETVTLTAANREARFAHAVE